MKKVLATGAALMMFGALATTAAAEVTISGTAKAEYVSQQNYDFMGVGKFDDRGDYFRSDIELDIVAKAEGGVFMKTRLNLLDDYNHNYQINSANDTDVTVDYAWLGVQMGDYTLEAGKMVASYSNFLIQGMDSRRDRVKLTWKGDGTKIIGLYDVRDEATTVFDAATGNIGQPAANEDRAAFGLVGITKITDDIKAMGYLRYQLDERDAGENEGLLVDLRLFGTTAGLSWEVEGVWLEADWLGNNGDDALGVYGQVAYSYDALEAVLNIGFAQNNYRADNEFGWIMIGGDEPISAITNVGLDYAGTGPDSSWWAGLTGKYDVSEDLQLVGNVVYYDVENTANLDSVYLEISGSLKYQISQNAKFAWKVGYLDADIDGVAAEENPFGMTGKLSISF